MVTGSAPKTPVSRNGPLVSVVIPTRDRAMLLRRALLSVLGQTYRDLEVIVVDDASNDGTADVVASIDDPRVRYYRHEDRRYASAARNTGIEKARGDYIAFLDDDDEWLPTKLSKQVRLMKDSPPEVGLVYCWMDHFDGQGRLVSQTHPTLRGYVLDQMLDRQRLGGCPTLLVRAAAVREIGGFDERLIRGNDGDFIRRICLRYQVDLLPEVLVRVHIGHGTRISDPTEQSLLAEVNALQIRLSKFGDQFRHHPRAHGATLRRLAVAKANAGNRTGLWAPLVRGIMLDPNLPDSILNGLRVLRAYFGVGVARAGQSAAEDGSSMGQIGPTTEKGGR